MKSLFAVALWLLADARSQAGAFQSPRCPSRSVKATSSVTSLFVVEESTSSSYPSPTRDLLDATTSSRRQWASDVLSRGATMAGLAVATSTARSARSAGASGGATAGGAYLLSAKQRYNERVKEGVKGFLSLKKFVDAGDVDGIRPYFASEDTGSWKDLSTAGYLLANAFRRNSTAAPDSLPSVQKWKAFAAHVESMIKAFKKKDVKSAQAAYQSALDALDAYLEKVELPNASSL